MVEGSVVLAEKRHRLCPAGRRENDKNTVGEGAPPAMWPIWLQLQNEVAVGPSETPWRSS